MGLMKWIARGLTATGLAALVISATVGARAEHNEGDWSDIDILLLIWSEASNPFFEPLVNGAMDAAAQQGVTIDIQFGEEDPVRTSNVLETSIATGIDGIAFNIADDDAYDDILCGAEEKGIPSSPSISTIPRELKALAGWPSWARISSIPAT